MATNFPATIDTVIQLPTVVDNVSGVSATSVNNLQGAIFQIERTLGVNPGGTFGTVGNRLNALEAIIAQLQQGGGGGQTGTSVTFSGDLTGNAAHQTVIGLVGVPLPGSPPATGNVLQAESSSELIYGPVNLAGGPNAITGDLPIGNLAAGSNGQVLIATGGQALWATGPVGPTGPIGATGPGAPTGFIPAIAATAVATPVVSKTIFYDISNNYDLSTKNPTGIVQVIQTQIALNVKDYGAYGNGSTDDSTAIQAATNAATISVGVVCFPSGTYRLSHNVTTPAGIILQFQAGASISVDSGKTLTINGMIDANVYQVIFDGYGTNVQLGTAGGQIREISAVWFGADPTGNNDSYPAIMQAIYSMPDFPLSSSGPHWSTPVAGPTWPNSAPTTSDQGWKLILPAGAFWVTQTITVARSCVLIEGSNSGIYIGAATSIVTVPGITAIKLLGPGCKVRNIAFSHNGASINGMYKGVNGFGSAINGTGQLFPTWMPAHTYVAGDIVVPNYSIKYGYAFQCMVGGISAGPVAGWDNVHVGFTITITNATAGHIVSFYLTGNNEAVATSHHISYTITGSEGGVDGVAAAVADLIEAIPSYTVLIGTVTQSGATIEVMRTNGYTYLYEWNTAQMSVVFYPAANWRSYEPTWPRTYSYDVWTPNSYFGGFSVVPQIANGHYYTGTTGTSGATPPIWPTNGSTVVDGTITWTDAGSIEITDNTVTWVPILAHGVSFYGGYCSAEECGVFGFPGHAFAIPAEEPYFGINGAQITNCLHQGMGGCGFAAWGNSGEHTTKNLIGEFPRGWAIRSEGDSNSVHITPTSEDAFSGLFYSDCDTVISPYKEGVDAGSVVTAGSVWIGGVQNGPGVQQAVGFPGIGLGGYSAALWQANTTYTANSYIIPITQPDSSEPFIYFTAVGGTSGSSEPSWVPGYGLGNTPDFSITIDGTVPWQVVAYATFSNGGVIGSAPSTSANFTKNWAFGSVNTALPLTVNVSIANSDVGAVPEGSDATAFAFNVTGDTDSTATILVYDDSAKYFYWAYGSFGGPAGMAHLLNGNPYSWGNNVETSQSPAVAFPYGFFMGHGGAFTQILAGYHPGYEYQAVPFAIGTRFAPCGSVEQGNAAGTASEYTNISAGNAYATWTPNTFYATGTYVLSSPSNNHLYEATKGGTGAALPVTWSTSGGTGADGNVIWKDIGTTSNGYSTWLGINPIISEDIYYLNLSGQSSPYTLSEEECAHRIIRIFNASGTFTIIAKTASQFVGEAIQYAPLNTWSKTFDNKSGYQVTIAAIASDAGVTVPNGFSMSLFSDGLNVKFSTSIPIAAALPSGTYFNATGIATGFIIPATVGNIAYDGSAFIQMVGTGGFKSAIAGPSGAYIAAMFQGGNGPTFASDCFVMAISSLQGTAIGTGIYGGAINQLTEVSFAGNIRYAAGCTGPVSIGFQSINGSQTGIILEGSYIKTYPST
jgi:pectate lyase-like protein